MTPDEIFNKAVKQMNQCYTSGIRCIDDAKSVKSVRFFRAFTQGEIEGIYKMAIEMYLAFIYNVDNEDEAGEHVAYREFCIRILERSKALSEQISEYACDFINENIVE